MTGTQTLFSPFQFVRSLFIRRGEDSAIREKREINDEAALQHHLLNALLATATLGIIVIACCCITFVFEVHTIRVTQAQASQDLHSELIARLDSALWKTDTFLTLLNATNKNLASGLMQVRVQVKESSDAQTHSTEQISKATTNAVHATIQATSDVIKAVVDQPAPVVEIKAEKPTVIAPPPAEIKFVPEPVPMSQPKVEKKVDVKEEPPKRHGMFHWLRWLWPFRR